MISLIVLGSEVYQRCAWMGATEKDEATRAETAYLDAEDETFLAEAILETEEDDATLERREATRAEVARLVTWTE